MRAVRVHRFGGPDALVVEEIPRPVPGPGQALVRVRAAGVGPWDAWVRSGRSALPQPLPLTPGSDVSGTVVELADDVEGFAPGDEVYGVTNARFTGGYAEYAVVESGMIARKPARMPHVEAASIPVVATTAYQMVFDHGGVGRSTRVLVHGAAGNVGRYAVALARRAGADLAATASARDVAYVRALGVDRVVDLDRERFESATGRFDVVLDTVGGDLLARSLDVLEPGGVLVSSVAAPDAAESARRGVRGVFFLVSVTTAGLERLARLFESGELAASVGEVLPLAEARRAHEMLAGAPHGRGKIVLSID